MGVRNICLRLAAPVALLGLSAGPANAAVVSSNPAVEILNQEDVTFPQFGNFTGQTTIVQKTFDKAAQLETTITWDSGDLDFLASSTGTKGFRWFTGCCAAPTKRPKTLKNKGY